MAVHGATELLELLLDQYLSTIEIGTDREKLQLRNALHNIELGSSSCSDILTSKGRRSRRVRSSCLTCIRRRSRLRRAGYQEKTPLSATYWQAGQVRMKSPSYSRSSLPHAGHMSPSLAAAEHGFSPSSSWRFHQKLWPASVSCLSIFTSSYAVTFVK